jgi:putative redox protein
MPEGIRSEYPVELVWEGGQRFSGGPPGVPAMRVDGGRQAGPSPVDALLVALGSCSAIDVVDILEKRRTPVSALSVRIEFSRAPAPPRRVTEARLHFEVATDSEAHHVERAIELSMSKYCSVASTFAPDTDLAWTTSVKAADAGR